MRREESQLGEIEIQDLGGKITTIPAYVCGHCNGVVALNPNRHRERRKCTRCGSLICEMNPVCLTECLDLTNIARCHFEGEHGLRASAVMHGATTSEQVDRFVFDRRSH